MYHRSLSSPTPDGAQRPHGYGWPVHRAPARHSARPLRRRRPTRGPAAGSGVDRLLAAFVLVVETLVCLTLWGPQPVAWLWVGSQVDYHTGSVTLRDRSSPSRA